MEPQEQLNVVLFHVLLK